METVLINPGEGPPPAVNTLLIGRGRQHYVRDFAGPLSIKTVIRGYADWDVLGRRYRLGPGPYLLVNDSQSYSVTVDSPQPVETFCVFFRRGLVEDAARVGRQPAERLLDNPAVIRQIDFGQPVAGPEHALAPALASLRQTALDGDDLVPGLLDLVEALAGRERLPAARASTRDELLRRVLRGREYIEAHAGRAVSLEEASRAACLSPFHFHRAFRRVFGKTPHEHAASLRLEHAAKVLATTGAPVTVIALEAGFETPGAFATAFRKRFGQSPSEFRKIGEVRLAAVH